jgi:hypothetical protein
VHQEPPEETCAELELDVGVDEGDLRFDAPDADPFEFEEAVERPLLDVVSPDERLEPDDALACVVVMPGRL